MSCQVLHLDGGFDLRPAEPSDAETIAGWMGQPHIRQWWHQDWSAERWSEELKQQLSTGYSTPCIAGADGRDFGYVELYRVRHDRLAEYYAYDEHDWGVHLAIGDTDRLGQGLGSKLLRAIGDALLAVDPLCRCVVAEPDTDNVRSIRAFTTAGFVDRGELQLPEKTARLMVRWRTETCTT